MLPRASLTGFHAALPIFDLERRDLHLGALPEGQLTLAEPSTLRLLGYNKKAPFGALFKSVLTDYCIFINALFQGFSLRESLPSKPFHTVRKLTFFHFQKSNSLHCHNVGKSKQVLFHIGLE